MVLRHDALDGDRLLKGNKMTLTVILLAQRRSIERRWGGGFSKQDWIATFLRHGGQSPTPPLPQKRNPRHLQMKELG